MDDNRTERGDEPGTWADREQPGLPADRVFVVQFRRSSVPPLDEPTGRVEHLLSGVATEFATWRELHRFVEQVLGQFDPGRSSGGAGP